MELDAARSAASRRPRVARSEDRQARAAASKRAGNYAIEVTLRRSNRTAMKAARRLLPAAPGLLRAELHATGGHVGFVAPSAAPRRFWAAERALDFVVETLHDCSDWRSAPAV